MEIVKSGMSDAWKKAPVSYESRVKLAIEGVTADGWYPMGEIEVKKRS